MHLFINNVLFNSTYFLVLWWGIMQSSGTCFSSLHIVLLWVISLPYNILLWKHITSYLSRILSGSCQRHLGCFYLWYYLRRRNVIRLWGLRTFCHFTAEKLLYMPSNGAFVQVFLHVCMYACISACLYVCITARS